VTVYVSLIQVAKRVFGHKKRIVIPYIFSKLITIILTCVTSTDNINYFDLTHSRYGPKNRL